MPDRLSTRPKDSILQMESGNVSLMELLRPVLLSGYITPRRNKDISSGDVE